MKLLIATAALVCAPLPALAQTWPVAIVAGVQAMQIQIRTLAPTGRGEVEALRAETVAQATASRPANRLALKLRPSVSVDPDDAPDVDIPAKAEWSDDQGLRIGGTKLAYKRRF